ncbi:hypothetical protein [Streptomyces sp. KR80]|uniref:hypothetical protein n=1 Tax=Streptomyces sp. KR80 TaxID=3457426 RepID=UPI003FCF9DEF
MEAAILILALLFVAFVALGAYVTVKVVGAAKRGVDRTVAQARRAVEDTTLRAKQLAQPGVLGDLAELRVSLRTSMRATQDALHAAPPEDAAVSEASRLFQRLSAHGIELDDDLKRLEREPDKGRITERLPELRERTERIVRHADSLRWAAQDRALRFADDDLAALGRQIDVEAGALRHWTSEPGAPGGTEASATAGSSRAAADPAVSPGTASQSAAASAETPASAQARASAQTPGSGSGKPGATPAPGSDTPAPTPTPTWPDVSRPDAVAQEPPAITEGDPRRQFAYPWEKERRPESTT